MENRIKNHFENEAKEFDEIIVKLIPYYNQIVDAMVDAIPFPNDRDIKVIDLGCGTGTISKKVLEKYPKAKITCVDIAEKMLEIAKYKLGDSENFRYISGDFNSFEFDDTYDVIVSSLALHHLATDEDKNKFYGKIYETLNEGGVFYNSDVVLGSSDYLIQMNMGKWKEFMIKNEGLEKVENKWLPNYYAEDSPCSLMKHLKMLEENRFKEVDVIWKYYNFSVYGGKKE